MKILFTDLDGTLLNNQSRVSEYTKKVLEEMVSRGHKLVLSSGRPLDSIKGVAKADGLTYPGIYIVANNGSTVYDCDSDRIIMEKTVDFEYVDKVWNLCLDRGIHIQTYTSDSVVSCADDEEIKVYTSKIFLPVINTIKPLEVLTKKPYKLLAIELKDKSILDKLQADIIAKYGDTLNAIFSEPKYLEIFNRNAGKGEALKWLCEYLNIPIENSYAAGDQMNDLSMVQEAGHGIAMCNGAEMLMKQASIISTETNDEDGLAHLIEKYILEE